MLVLDRKFLYILIAVIFAIALGMVILLFGSSNSSMPKRISIETEISEKLNLLELNAKEAKVDLKLAILEIDKLKTKSTTKNTKERIESLKSRVVKIADELELMDFKELDLDKLKVSEENTRKNKIDQSKIIEVKKGGITAIMREVELEMLKTTDKNFTTAELFYLHEHLKSARVKLNNILRLLDELKSLVS
jgi:hypothetical protein